MRPVESRNQVKHDISYAEVHVDDSDDVDMTENKTESNTNMVWFPLVDPFKKINISEAKYSAMEICAMRKKNRHQGCKI